MRGSGVCYFDAIAGENFVFCERGELRGER